MDLIVLSVVFLGTILLSLNIAMAMFLASAAVVLVSGIPFELIVQKAVAQLSLFPLLAIPAFILAGELMNATGLTAALGNLARALVGHWRSGLGLSTVLVCMFFGGLTGSGLADTVAVATMMIPILARHGYPKPFAAAIIASAGSLGPIIPPSIPMVIYASIVPSVSIAALFVGGILPGLLIGMGLMAVTAVMSRRLVPNDKGADDLQAPRWLVVLRALPAIVVPFLVLFGIVGGVVTVTEAAVLAVVYAMGYGAVCRTLSMKALYEAAYGTVLATGLVGLIIAAAGPFSFFLALNRAPEAVGQLLLDLSFGNSSVTMIILCLALFLLGMLVEATSLVIILAPIIAGTAAVAGIDQLHIAIVAITALMIGLFTPPVGTNLFAVCSISGEPIERVSRYAIPFMLMAMAVVTLLAVLPAAVTYLPNVLLGR
jgi:tripartite ATP-independent transporter DctM subunit